MLQTDRIKGCRESKGITQSEIARILGIELRSYVRYEAGDRQPSLDMLCKIADFFEVSTDYLLGRENDKNN